MTCCPQSSDFCTWCRVLAGEIIVFTVPKVYDLYQVCGAFRRYLWCPLWSVSKSLPPHSHCDFITSREVRCTSKYVQEDLLGPPWNPVFLVSWQWASLLHYLFLPHGPWPFVFYSTPLVPTVTVTSTLSTADVALQLRFSRVFCSCDSGVGQHLLVWHSSYLVREGSRMWRYSAAYHGITYHLHGLPWRRVLYSRMLCPSTRCWFPPMSLHLSCYQYLKCLTYFY